MKKSKKTNTKLKETVAKKNTKKIGEASEDIEGVYRLEKLRIDSSM